MARSDRLLRRLPVPHIITSSGDTPPREELLKDDHGRRYLKSWLAIRLTVGLLGLLMPVLLIGGDVLVLAGGPSTRGSLSAYYHSGMRDVFVGILCVVGIFLVTYKISERDWDNGLTLIAGPAAVAVALFPTWRDRAGQPLTSWQERLGEPTVAHIHLGAAAFFTISLALVSFRFGHRDALRQHSHALAHRLCGGVMIAVLVALVPLKLASVEEIGDYAVLLGVELICTVAFGISWILKGMDLRRAIQANEPKADPTPARQVKEAVPA